MKKLTISFFLGFLTFSIIGSVAAFLFYLPEFAALHNAYPSAVNENPEPVSGTLLGIIQLIVLVVLMDKLKIDSVKNGAILGAVFSGFLWLMVDLQMVSLTSIFNYDFLVVDVVISTVLGLIGGAVIAWSQKKYS
jgi:hypothetical protein